MTFFAWKAPRAIRKWKLPRSEKKRVSPSTASAGTSGSQAAHAPIAVPNIVPIVLEARAGAPERPAVRIFLGTEPAQYRAERIFVYSLEQVRNPNRRYEVYRMIRLPGFDESRWRTGFTNYRFAIPDLAGRHGRAIYNDVDQIYTADPADLFDQPMGEHGYLALTPNDTAVALIDCERMIEVWNFEKARCESKKALHAQAAEKPGLWGQLDPVWHARDLEYEHGRSRLLHYTTLHLQPWRPTPEQYSYQINPYAEYFLSLEQAANAKGYEPYTMASPSSGFNAACQTLASPPASLPSDVLSFASALSGNDIAFVGHWTDVHKDSLATTHYRFEQLRQPDLPSHDLLAVSGLEHLPPEDVPWLVDRLFRLSRSFVYIRAGMGTDESLISSIKGWRALLRRVSQRYPDRCWQLDCEDGNGTLQRYLADFPLRSRRAEALPKVWVLLGQHAGDNAQLVAIAESLGWPYECKETRFKPAKYVPGALLQGKMAQSAPGLAAPWPDLVLSSGRRTAPVAHWIQRRSEGRSRLVVVGRPRAPLSSFDLVLTTPQYSLPLRDNVVDLPVPFIQNQIPSDQELAVWKERFAHLPRPWVAMLVGGSSIPYELDKAAGRTLGAQASAAVGAKGGSLLISTSPRTAEPVTQSLLEAIETPHWCYRFEKGSDNPYRALLALADAFIVTGESVSMLTEAALTGKPVAVFPLPVRRHFKARVHHALERKLGVIDRVAGSRGTPRQQNKTGRLYDSLVEEGLIKRERRIEEVHVALGLLPLPQGLDQVPGLSPALMATSRQRAIEAVRAVITGERALSANRI
ncbi:ELM1/GtrOC1 family putative glycosyltransferase [Pseudomonas luteola]